MTKASSTIFKVQLPIPEALATGSPPVPRALLVHHSRSYIVPPPTPFCPLQGLAPLATPVITMPAVADMYLDTTLPPLATERSVTSSDTDPCKVSRTFPVPPPLLNNYTKAFLLRTCNGARIFSSPSRVSHALHGFPIGKYIIEGDTRSLSNGSSLVISVWEHNILGVPDLLTGTFTLGDWQVTCRRTDDDGTTFTSGKIGPLADDTDLQEVCHAQKAMDNTDIHKICWIHSHHIPPHHPGSARAMTVAHQKHQPYQLLLHQHHLILAPNQDAVITHTNQPPPQATHILTLSH
ncbi:uncharacterized protein LOC135099879 [Scylla paramamosain]|uniref:uncharacterized protein LOC135099879 n=1 Tax=Scylla paramamosain TaxID=85552 RepID=UPI003083948D